MSTTAALFNLDLASLLTALRWPLTIVYVSLIALIGAYGLHRYWLVFLFNRHRKHVARPARRFEQLPRVTVQLPMFNEGLVARRIIDAACKIDYPADRLQIQVIDDSTDHSRGICADRVTYWRAKGVDIELRHRVDRTGYKAGALAEAMSSATGELIAIFDADFIPPRNFLKRTVHHFTDSGVGMVQTRWAHLNRDDSLLTRGQAIFLDGHFVVEHTARNRSGAWINFNGTAGLWRASAINDAGGWQHDTLTEDVDLSYRAQLRGWRFLFLPQVTCPAELPPEINAFKSQQHRWTKGSIQVCKKILGDVWRSKAPLAIKLEATAHLTSNFAYLLTLCTLVLMYPANFVMGSSWHKAVFVDVPVFFFASFSVVVFYMTAQGSQSRWGWLKALPYVPMLLALGIGMSINNGKAVLEALLNQESDFVRTPKYGIATQAQAATKKSRYKAGKSIALWLEVAITGYFGWLIFLAAQRGQWGSIPFLLLFFSGFAFVSGSSLLKRFSMERFQAAPATV